MLSTFNTPMELVEAAKTASAKSSQAQSQLAGYGGWSGPAYSDLRELALKGGDETHVRDAENLLTKMEAALPETERAEFIPSVSGAYPCVPDAILGLPEPMRRKTVVFTDAAPIKLGVILTVSAGCSDAAIRARGLAMLAIMMQLVQSGRAVELYAINILDCPGDKHHESVIATKVSDGILSLAQADMVLCNSGFARRLPFTVQYGFHNTNGGWPGGFDYNDGGKVYAAGLAQRMGFKMILPAMTNRDDKEVISNPVKWMLDKYNAIQAQIEAGT